MKPLYTPEEFLNSEQKKLLPLECENCKKPFYTMKKYIIRVNKNKSENLNYDIKNIRLKYCSKQCRSFGNGQKIHVNCNQCGIQFSKFLNQFKKSQNHFCSQKCSGTYNALHKKHGTRRSKLEVWLESKLTVLYPNLEFHFNRKDAINSELDIYIPTLKLAFELNGIFHYEPIFGQEKLEQSQNNDHRKFQPCGEQGISLCIIDTSKQTYVKESTSQKYLDIITNIIDFNLCK